MTMPWIFIAAITLWSCPSPPRNCRAYARVPCGERPYRGTQARVPVTPIDDDQRLYPAFPLEGKVSRSVDVGLRAEDELRQSEPGALSMHNLSDLKQRALTAITGAGLRPPSGIPFHVPQAS
eukprot:COSAG02_NODE_12255_length_1572_cov_82.055669_2_plen_122_part_00